jgi:hypothetical protein
MTNTKRIARGSLLLGLIGVVFGCVIAPREGDFDRDHHRYYREHAWHECTERDEHCR